MAKKQDFLLYRWLRKKLEALYAWWQKTEAFLEKYGFAIVLLIIGVGTCIGVATFIGLTPFLVGLDAGAVYSLAAIACIVGIVAIWVGVHEILENQKTFAVPVKPPVLPHVEVVAPLVIPLATLSASTSSLTLDSDAALIENGEPDDLHSSSAVSALTLDSDAELVENGEPDDPHSSSAAVPSSGPS
jgi:hypothetical protein